MKASITWPGDGKRLLANVEWRWRKHGENKRGHAFDRTRTKPAALCGRAAFDTWQLADAEWHSPKRPEAGSSQCESCKREIDKIERWARVLINKAPKPAVDVSPYGRAVARLHKLTPSLEKVFSEALEDLRRQRDEARNALAAISLDEYESTSSASEKVKGHARLARRVLYGKDAKP